MKNWKKYWYLRVLLKVLWKKACWSMCSRPIAHIIYILVPFHDWNTTRIKRKEFSPRQHLILKGACEIFGKWGTPCTSKEMAAKVRSYWLDYLFTGIWAFWHCIWIIFNFESFINYHTTYCFEFISYIYNFWRKLIKMSKESDKC